MTRYYDGCMGVFGRCPGHEQRGTGPSRSLMETVTLIMGELAWLEGLGDSITVSLGPGTLLYRSARRVGVSVRGALAYRDLVLSGMSRIYALRVARLVPSPHGEIPYRQEKSHG